MPLETIFTGPRWTLVSQHTRPQALATGVPVQYLQSDWTIDVTLASAGKEQ